MKRMRGIRGVVVFLAAAGTLLPTSLVVADGNLPPAPGIADVALGEGGTLVGQMLDPQGVPQAKVRVSLVDVQNREVAATVTDEQGNFSVPGLRAGVYQIVTPQGRGIYRLWSPGTAPPSAQRGALLVAGGDAVRGAAPRSGLKFWLTNPLVIGAAVATAIAVPVAIHNSKRDNPSSPN